MLKILTTNKTYRNVRVGTGAWILALALAAGFVMRAHAADTQAQGVLKKMTAAYALQTYQGTAVLTLKGETEDSKPFSLKGAQEVTYKSPNLFLVRAEGEAIGGTEIQSSDGKQRMTYHSANNQYMKMPLPFDASKGTLSLLSLFGVSVDPQSGKMVGSGAVGGHAAYLIQAMLLVPPLKPDATRQERAVYETFKKTLQPFDLAIDKKDYRLLRVVQTSGEPKMTRTLEFTRQSFNLALADSAFVFTPPPGAESATAANRKMFGGSMKSVGKSATPGAASSGKGGGNPVPPPHASPGAGGVNSRP
jgi:outer membrane lipoprotein-sorting protein